MKCSIRSAAYWRPKDFIDEYAQIIVGAGFELCTDEDEDEEFFFYIILNSLEELEKLSKAVKSDIIFESGGGLIIYDDYME